MTFILRHLTDFKAGECSQSGCVEMETEIALFQYVLIQPIRLPSVNDCVSASCKKVFSRPKQRILINRQLLSAKKILAALNIIKSKNTKIPSYAKLNQASYGTIVA